MGAPHGVHIADSMVYAHTKVFHVRTTLAAHILLQTQAFIAGYHEGVKKGEQRVHEAAEQLLKEQQKEQQNEQQQQRPDG